MLTKKKKLFILIGMAILLVVTGYLNVALTRTASKTPTGTTTETNFLPLTAPTAPTRATLNLNTLTRSSQARQVQATMLQRPPTKNLPLLHKWRRNLFWKA